MFQAFAMYAVLALAATGFFFITIIGSVLNRRWARAISAKSIAVGEIGRPRRASPEPRRGSPDCTARELRFPVNGFPTYGGTTLRTCSRNLRYLLLLQRVVLHLNGLRPTGVFACVSRFLRPPFYDRDRIDWAP